MRFRWLRPFPTVRRQTLPPMPRSRLRSRTDVVGGAKLNQALVRNVRTWPAMLIVVRNRLELLPSRNQRQIDQVLEAIRTRLGFRTARGLSERLVYREFFAAGLTAFDPMDGPVP